MSILVILQIDGLLDGILFGIPLIWLVAIGGVLSLALGIFVRVQMEKRRDPFRPKVNRISETVAESPRQDDTANAEPPGPEPTSSDGESFESEEPILLRAAANRVASDEFTEAIQAAYSHTRMELGERFGIETPGTHWDFYEECVAQDTTAPVEGLEELTEIYERAAFGSSLVDRADAERALALAVKLTEAESPETSPQ